MKTLHLYLTRQILATLLMTVAVFTFVLLLGNALKDILALLISGQATLGNVARAFGLLIPWLLAFALPMGMLTAALLVFGRFSADQELTAVRASGVSLVALIAPILLLSLLMCGVCAWINMDVAPRCRVAFTRLRDDMAGKLVAATLPEGRYTSIPGGMVYVRSVDGPELHDIIAWYTNQSGEDIICKASSGRITTTNLVLYDVADLVKTGEGWSPGQHSEVPIPLGRQAGRRSDDKPSITDMTYRQLAEELRGVENRFGTNTSDLTIDQLYQFKSFLEEHQVDPTMPLRVQMHRQLAFSFACFGFTLVGIPLGIRAHRRETNVGFAIALGLVMLYYSFIILGQSLQTHSEWAPYLIMWIPNFIFQATGAVMLWRANRGI